MKEMLKLGLVLACFAAVACVALAFVNNLTAPTIAKVEAEKANAGMKAVFTDADYFMDVEGFTSTVINGVTIDKVCYAYKNDEKVGVVVQATGSTYDKATILVGINTDKTITGINFLAISDTPGFGQKAAEPTFYEQFAGKDATSSFVPGTDFDGISGATITTNGVANILSEAAKIGVEYLDAI